MATAMAMRRPQRERWCGTTPPWDLQMQNRNSLRCVPCRAARCDAAFILLWLSGDNGAPASHHQQGPRNSYPADLPRRISSAKRLATLTSEKHRNAEQEQLAAERGWGGF